MFQLAEYGAMRDTQRHLGHLGGETAGKPGVPVFDQLVRQEEAAALLSVSPRCMENWRYRGEGPDFVRVSGRCVRYRRSDLDKWIEERVRTNTSDRGNDAA